jgi:transaldolase
MRGLEPRTSAGLSSDVRSVASLFISRWDVAVAKKVPAALHDRIGIAIARRAYKAYRDLLDTDRWLRLVNFGARSQRLLMASTGTKDPKASDVLYVVSLAAPHTVNTMPENTLTALADHGDIGAMLPRDGGNAEAEVAEFAKAGIDSDALAEELQREGAESFVKSWDELMSVIEHKTAQLKKAG